VTGLLERHVDGFNAGVRTGDWESMLEQFDDAAELEFRGIPVGPFTGKNAIAAAYRGRPPDDQLRVLEQRERGDGVEARYAWLAEPEVAAGEMLITADAGRIQKLVVTFDRGVEWS
jgi:hypothetical protein